MPRFVPANSGDTLVSERYSESTLELALSECSDVDGTRIFLARDPAKLEETSGHGRSDCTPNVRTPLAPIETATTLNVRFFSPFRKFNTDAGQGTFTGRAQAEMVIE